ncbi:MAG: glycosyltransferase family 2 protein [Candidatus Riflebacteria bacterium]|nr:glycosyltransferase family 2 protein [Candidatus Riflebacteria bacterium]
MSHPELSVVIPVYNEEEVLPSLFKELDGVLAALGLAHEIILVNDGSRDGSLELLERFVLSRSDVKVVDLSRNFGHQAAISAGLDCARGDAVIVMDADLQDPPDLIPELVTRWRQGFDVVSAVRKEREGESFLKRALTYVFYRILRAVAGVDIPVDVGDFRLIGRSVVDQVKLCRERNRFVRGIIAWVGFRPSLVEYVRPGRLAGQTKYSWRKLLRLALDGLASFSYLPLQLASWLGFCFAFLAFAYASWAVAVIGLGHHPPAGWTSLAFVVLGLGGVQLICLGTIGEYLGRVYDEVRGRPLYIVRRVIEPPSS